MATFLPREESPEKDTHLFTEAGGKRTLLGNRGWNYWDLDLIRGLIQEAKGLLRTFLQLTGLFPAGCVLGPSVSPKTSYVAGFH